MYTEMLKAVKKSLGPMDTRITRYPMMDSPKVIVVLSIVYLLFVKIIGPLWMKHRKPYDLRKSMITHNISLAILNGWATVNILRYGWLTTYSWRCEPVGFSKNPVSLEMVRICWFFFLAKLSEYFDTVTLIQKKKYSEITFLHVFHRFIVPIIVWFGISYGPGGYNTFFPLLNSFVSIWIYLYHALSPMGPRIQKYLWWKKYLTKLHLVQFIIVIVYFSHLLLFAPKHCKVSKFLIWLHLGPSIIYLFLIYFNAHKRQIVKQSSQEDSERQNQKSSSQKKKK